MLELTQHIAATLQLLRKQKSWSLDKAAQATGVSKAMLGQIERGESSPTVATLWKIATGFQTSFSTFLEPSVAPQTLWLGDSAAEIKHMTGGNIAAKPGQFLDPTGADERIFTVRHHKNCLNQRIDLFY